MTNTNIIVRTVERPPMICGDDPELWLQILDGSGASFRHLGYVPCSTSHDDAVWIGRKWASENSAIAIRAMELEQDHLTPSMTRFI